jgi:hypothetical protein
LFQRSKQGCYKELEKYTDEVAENVLWFGLVLIILVSFMLPFYIQLYWEYR